MVLLQIKEVKDDLMALSRLLYEFDYSPTDDKILGVAEHVFTCIASMKQDIIKCRKGKFE